MIEERVREMSADERASLQRAMRPPPPGVWHSGFARETWALLVFGALGLLLAVWRRGWNLGAFVAVAAGGVLVIGYRFVAEARGNARRLKNVAVHAAHRAREIDRILQDGRVRVRRVHAEAVVEIEPLEDEGTGYVFDLGDGRVLFLKGSDYTPEDEDARWPNTDFEIVRAATGNWLFELRCHGSELTPLRVVSRDDVDPQRGWDAREEVLRMSVDDAVRTVLRTP